MAGTRAIRMVIGGAITIMALGLGSIGVAADTACSPAGGTVDNCSTDNSQSNNATINSSPTQNSSTAAKGGAGGAPDFFPPCFPICIEPFAGPALSPVPVGDGGGAVAVTEQTQTTTNSIGQAINSHNASDSFNGNGPAVNLAPLGPIGSSHLVVMGGHEFAASGLGDASFVSLPVGGASNTGGHAVAP